MRTTEERLAEEVDKAMYDVAEETGREAVQAAISGDELPANPEVLLHGIFRATKALEDYWGAFAEGAAAAIHGEGELVEVDDGLVGSIERAVQALLERALAEAGAV